MATTKLFCLKACVKKACMKSPRSKTPFVSMATVKRELRERSSANARVVWKLLGLLMLEYEAEDSKMIDDLKQLLKQLDADDFDDRIRRVISRYLSDRVSF